MDNKEKWLQNAVDTHEKMLDAVLEAENRRKWFDVSIQAAREMGNSAIEIAEATGMTRQHIHRVLHKFKRGVYAMGDEGKWIQVVDGQIPLESVPEYSSELSYKPGDFVSNDVPWPPMAAVVEAFNRMPGQEY